MVPVPLNQDSKLNPFLTDDNAGTEAYLPEKMFGDQIRLKQILVNLVKNAMKFSQTKPIKILTGYDFTEQMLHVQIIDEGKGIKQEQLEKLFSLFDQVDRDSFGNLEGVGMGLNICTKIVNENGGSISVFSEGENKGATFQFSMFMRLFKVDVLFNSHTLTPPRPNNNGKVK